MQRGGSQHDLDASGCSEIGLQSLEVEDCLIGAKKIPSLQGVYSRQRLGVGKKVTQLLWYLEVKGLD